MDDDLEASADGPAEASRRRVRRHARRAALGATAVALAVYVLMCLVADLAVLEHLEGAVDARLRTRLDALVAAHRAPTVSPARGPAVPDGDGLDDAPVLAWWVPAGSRAPRRLEREAPLLPLAAAQPAAPHGATIGARAFRVAAATTPSGRYVAATSVEELFSIRATLLTAEAALLPLALAAFYLVAYAIGRRAAAPVERARTQQLDFTADASHELRTPLSVIEAEVGLALAADRTAPELRCSLERVGAESHRLGGIVDDLLWLARADSLPEGRAPSGAVELHALAEDAVTRFEPVAAHRGLDLRVADAGDGAVVEVPADWLDRLLSVLLDNACRYVEAGGQIEVRVTAEGARCVVSVDDSGPGIPPAVLPGLFGRFRRATFEPGGAGLGLAIADTIVRSTGGRWEVGRSRWGGARMGASWPRATTGAPLPRSPRGRHVAGGR